MTFAFKAATSRPPVDKEIKLLEDLYAEELANFKKEPVRADTLLSVGEHAIDQSLKATELAAKTIVASTILNLDETITKE